MEVGDKLFVYGTLRKDGRFHGILSDGGAVYVDRGVITATMRSINDSVPVIELTDFDRVVHGEVYVMTNDALIQRIQRLEGGYGCAKTSVSRDGDNPGLIDAWVFHANQDLWGIKLHELPIVESGDWIKHIQAQS